MFVITSDIDDCITFAREQDALEVRDATGWSEFSAAIITLFILEYIYHENSAANFAYH